MLSFRDLNRESRGRYDKVLFKPFFISYSTSSSSLSIQTKRKIKKNKNKIKKSWSTILSYSQKKINQLSLQIYLNLIYQKMMIMMMVSCERWDGGWDEMIDEMMMMMVSCERDGGWDGFYHKSFHKFDFYIIRWEEKEDQSTTISFIISFFFFLFFFWWDEFIWFKVRW